MTSSFLPNIKLYFTKSIMYLRNQLYILRDWSRATTSVEGTLINDGRYMMVLTLQQATGDYAVMDLKSLWRLIWLTEGSSILNNEV